MNEFVMAIALVGASVAVMPAQGAPAVAARQSGITAAGRARGAGAPKPYTYDPAGRRDPFVSLLSRGIEPAGGKKLTGLAGLTTGEVMVRGVLQSRNSYVALVSGPDGKTYSSACERSPAGRHHPERDAAGHRHHAGSQRSALAGETARSAKGTQDRGRWQITHTDLRTSERAARCCCSSAGLWAAGLTPLDAFGPRRFARTKRPLQRNCRTGAAAEGDVGERGTPHHDDHHRDVRSGGVPDQPSRSADAVRRPARRRRERPRGTLCSARKASWPARSSKRPRAPTARASRASHPADLSRPPIRCAASATSSTSTSTARFRSAAVGNASSLAADNAGFGTVCDDARERARRSEAERAPAITLTGNGELVAESVTPLGDGTPRVVLRFRTSVRRRPPMCSSAADLSRSCTSRPPGPCRRRASSSIFCGRRPIA